MRGFDKHLHELLEAHPEAAWKHAKLFATLPLPTQRAILRCRQTLSQRAEVLIWKTAGGPLRNASRCSSVIPR